MKKALDGVHQPLVLWTIFFRLLMSISSVQGASLWDDFLPSSVSNLLKMVDVGITSDSPVSDLIVQFMNQFREGLKEAKADPIPVQDFEWIIDGGNVNGIIHTHNLTVSGLAGFKVKNVTTSVLSQTGDIRVEFPLIGLQADYELQGRGFGLFPIWADGKIDIKVIMVDGGFGAQLTDPTSLSMHVTNPKLTIQGIHVTMDGFMGNMQMWHVILIGLSIILVIVSMSVGVVVMCMKSKFSFKSEMIRRNSSYRAVPEPEL